jgi:hypothetical protein
MLEFRFRNNAVCADKPAFRPLAKNVGITYFFPLTHALMGDSFPVSTEMARSRKGFAVEDQLIGLENLIVT